MPLSNSSSSLFNISSPVLLSPTQIRNRARSKSIVTVEQVGNNSFEESQDQHAFPDVNSEWVNRKGSEKWFGLLNLA